MWIDSHCHLDYFQNPQQVVENSINAGVSRIVANSTTLDGLHKVLALQKQFPKTVSAALGYYPTHVIEDSVKKRDETMQEIALHEKECIAFGEIGLDYGEKTTLGEKDLQTACFRKFIALSKEFKKPLIVHARGARFEVLRILKEQECKNVLLHSFVGKPSQAKLVLDTPFYISVGLGLLDKPWIQDFIKEIPLDRILLESDSPLMIGKEQCNPSWIVRIAHHLSLLKGESIQEIEAQTAKNFQKLFKL